MSWTQIEAESYWDGSKARAPYSSPQHRLTSQGMSTCLSVCLSPQSSQGNSRREKGFSHLPPLLKASGGIKVGGSSILCSHRAMLSTNTPSLQVSSGWPWPVLAWYLIPLEAASWHLSWRGIRADTVAATGAAADLDKLRGHWPVSCPHAPTPTPSPAPAFILAPNPGRCVYKFLYRTVMAEEEKKFSLTNLAKFIQLGEWAQNSSHLSVELMHLTFSSVKHLPIKPGVTHTHPVPGTKYIPQNICLMNGWKCVYLCLCVNESVCICECASWMVRSAGKAEVLELLQEMQKGQEWGCMLLHTSQL